MEEDYLVYSVNVLVMILLYNLIKNQKANISGEPVIQVLLIEQGYMIILLSEILFSEVLVKVINAVDVLKCSNESDKYDKISLSSSSHAESTVKKRLSWLNIIKYCI